MTRITTREMVGDDLHAAATLLAEAHGRALAAAPPGLRPGARFLDPNGCFTVVEQLFAAPRATGVMAEQGGRAVGFMVGARQLFAPEDFASIYAEPRSTSVPLHGHAVAGGVDAALACEAMYSALARRWVRDGFFVHNIAASALDRGMLDVWAGLGFGRKSVCAVRPTATIDGDAARRAEAATQASGVRIELVRGRDDDVLEDFHRDLMRFQTGAPMFWPYSGESDARVRAVRRDALLSGQGFAYVARDAAGHPLGSLLFVPSVFLSPLLVCEKMLYLWEGFVREGARAAGVGSLLLSHALDELAAMDVEWCALHFVSGNPRGGRFWPSRGFLPVEVVMHRHVDERVSWATGEGA